MDPQGWWGVLLQGAIASGMGGAVAAVTAWAVVSVTHRHEHRFALRMEARKAAVAMFHLAGEYLAALHLAAKDANAPLPTARSRDWLVLATGVEIAMFSLEGPIGPLISRDIGDVRRALDALGAGEAPRAEAIGAAARCAQKLADDLADWLMDGRQHSGSGAQPPTAAHEMHRSLEESPPGS